MTAITWTGKQVFSSLSSVIKFLAIFGALNFLSCPHSVKHCSSWRRNLWKLCGSCAFPQNLLTTKLVILVFCYLVFYAMRADILLQLIH